MTDQRSRATDQHRLGDADHTYPLEPPLTAGPPDFGPDRRAMPLEVGYDYAAVDTALFERPIGSGLERWAPLLPPLTGVSLQAGGTPLLELPSIAEWVDTDVPVYVKDESRNPTWSHKDRFNGLVASAALRTGADGIVLASTGNHGGSAAAHATRVGLPCIVFTVPGTPPAMEEFVRSYGAAVLRARDSDDLVDLVDAVADYGFHAATSRTRVPTGHPWGVEGYKTIAYETYRQLGSAPGTVLVPTAFAELLYGVWKGFRELSLLGVTDGRPRMVACEPATQAAHAVAVERGDPIIEIEPGDSEAHSIGGARSTRRGYAAIEESGGSAVPVPERTIAEAQRRLASAGLWQEFSAATAVGGLRSMTDDPDGPVVVVACSSGYKDGVDWSAPSLPHSPTLDDVSRTIHESYGLDVEFGGDGGSGDE